jgi:hypothetical protein
MPNLGIWSVAPGSVWQALAVPGKLWEFKNEGISSSNININIYIYIYLNT